MICGHQREDDCGCVQTPPDPKPTAPPTVAPASDEEISDTKERAKRVTAIGSVRALKLIARIEADRAENDRLRARVAELEDLICKVGHSHGVTYGGTCLCPSCQEARAILALPKSEPASR